MHTIRNVTSNVKLDKTDETLNVIHRCDEFLAQLNFPVAAQGVGISKERILRGGSFNLIIITREGDDLYVLYSPH